MKPRDSLDRRGQWQGGGRQPFADRRRVLIAGFNPARRLFTAYAFEDADYVVYAAADPHQALAFAVRVLPDVVVVQMEERETLDVLARLSERPSTFDIPVVVVTSLLQSIAARRARAAGGVTL